ncbi:MAG: hypothetical protein POH28_02540, partial [Acidocella sp.]|nr:hypothetical protein [Acidocella sp.]
FGKKLIEQYLPKIDLSHMIDTSGAYIPGHGTPTVILFGRHRPPVALTIRAVLGIRGEPSTPADPATGKVWSAILDQIDRAGSQSEFVSVNDTLRSQFAQYPWSIGGGGAAELAAELRSSAVSYIHAEATSIGPASFAGIDEIFVAPEQSMLRFRTERALVREMCIGEQTRDWGTLAGEGAFAPYGPGHDLIPSVPGAGWYKRVWPFRPCSEGMISFARRTRKDLGEEWWSWYRWIPERYHIRLSIAFAFVATHNHFVLDRGGGCSAARPPSSSCLPGQPKMTTSVSSACSTARSHASG